jgi:hypothetical protein
METTDLGELIGERELKATLPDGLTRPVFVRLYRPVLDPGDEEHMPVYTCTFFVDGYGAGIVKRGYGLDGIDAMQNALEMIGIDLEAYSAADGVKFTFANLPHGFPTNYWPATEAPTESEL